MNFDCDIFLSYSNNKESEVGSNTWADGFKKDLYYFLEKVTSNKFRIQSSDDVNGNQENSGIPKSAVYIIMLGSEQEITPDYIEELEIIKSISSEDTQMGIHIPRLFKIVESMIPEEKQPECIRYEYNYQFFGFDKATRKYIRFDQTKNPSFKGSKYWSGIVDLSHDITNSLKFLKGESFTGYVYVAETTADQMQSRQKIKREINKNGYLVLPDKKLLADNKKIKDILIEQVKSSLLAVHIVGSEYGDYIKGTYHSMVDFQIKAVKEYINDSIDSNSNLQQLIWIPSSIRPTSEKQKLFLERIKRENKSTKTEIVISSVDSFNKLVYQKLKDIAAENKYSGFDAKIYYLYPNSISSKDDTYQLIKDELVKNNIHCLELDYSSDNVVQEHFNFLAQCDGVIVHSADTIEWLRAKHRDIIKSAGIRINQNQPLETLMIGKNIKLEPLGIEGNFKIVLPGTNLRQDLTAFLSGLRKNGIK